MEISLAPAPITWGKKQIKEFYKKVALMPVDIAYIGETVCSKRSSFSIDDLKEITLILKENNKKVFISTLGLLTTTKEFEQVRKLFSIADGIEVNSLGVLSLLSEKTPGQEFVVGPFLNVYNKNSARAFLSLGASKIVLPAELSFKNISDIVSMTKELEISVWGNITCAISWRCYSARSFDLERKNCKMKCMEYPDGILLKNVDDKDIFLIDGTRVLAARDYCLIEQLDELKSIGIKNIRINPSRKHTAEIVNIFKQAVNGEMPLKEASSELKKYSTYGLSNGWFYSKAGIDYVD